MERIGKLQKEQRERGFSLYVKHGQWVAEHLTGAGANRIIAAAALHDSLIPPPDLERSGEMVEAHKCELGKWYYDEGWIKADSNGAVGGCEEITVFLSLEQTGVCSTFLSFMDEVELPRKPESEE